MLAKYMKFICTFLLLITPTKTCFSSPTNKNETDTQLPTTSVTASNTPKTSDNITDPTDSPLNLTVLISSNKDRIAIDSNLRTKIPFYNSSKIKQTSSFDTQIETPETTTNISRILRHNHKTMNLRFISKNETENKSTTVRPATTITQACTKVATITANKSFPQSTNILNELIKLYPTEGIKMDTQIYPLANTTRSPLSAFSTNMAGEFYTEAINPFTDSTLSPGTSDKPDLQKIKPSGYISTPEISVQDITTVSVESDVKLPPTSMAPVICINPAVTFQLLNPVTSNYTSINELNKSEATNQLEETVNVMAKAQEEFSNNTETELFITDIPKKQLLVTTLKSQFQSEISPSERSQLLSTPQSITSDSSKPNMAILPNFEQSTIIEGILTTFASKEIRVTNVSNSQVEISTTLANPITTEEDKSTVYPLTDEAILSTTNSITDPIFESQALPILDIKNASTILTKTATVGVDAAPTKLTYALNYSTKNIKTSIITSTPTIQKALSNIDTNIFTIPTSKKKLPLSCTSTKTTLSQTSPVILCNRKISSQSFSNTAASTLTISTQTTPTINPAPLTTPTLQIQPTLSSQTKSPVITSTETTVTLPVTNIVLSTTDSEALTTPARYTTNTATISTLTSVTHGTEFSPTTVVEFFTATKAAEMLPPTTPPQSLTTPLVKHALEITEQTQTMIASIATALEEPTTTSHSTRKTSAPLQSASEQLPNGINTSSKNPAPSATEPILKEVSTYSTPKSSTSKSSLMNFLKSILTKVPKSRFTTSSTKPSTTVILKLEGSTSEPMALTNSSIIHNLNSEKPVVITMVTSTGEPYFTTTSSGISPQNETNSQLIEYIKNHPVESAVALWSVAGVTTYSIISFISILKSVDSKN